MAIITAITDPAIQGKYTLADNTFTQEVKTDPRDVLTLEIGDAKQLTTFYPQIKILRWDNEYNLSARLIDNSGEEPRITTEGGKILYDLSKLTACFYDIPIGDIDYSEGAAEFEIILKEKPLTNQIQFTLQGKGVDFSYQAIELTPKEIAREVFRPDNVKGSYVVYATDNPINWEGGKLYRTGKVGHIYRPKIIDSLGNWVWGELNITFDSQTGTGLMSVTIPQKFLDEAVYPIRHAAGATFGYTTIGGTNINLGGDDFDSVIGIGAAGTATSISWYVDGVGTENLKGVLVLASNKLIVTNGIGGAAAVGASFGWVTSTFGTSPTVSAVNYYVGLVPSTSITGKYDTVGGTASEWYDLSNSYTSPSNPDDGASDNNWSESAYCTYTPIGGTAVKDIIMDSGIITFPR